jgi:plastocyanin
MQRPPVNCRFKLLKLTIQIYVSLLLGSLAWGQTNTLAAHVEVRNPGKSKNVTKASDAVIWLTPLNFSGVSEAGSPPQHPRLIQRDKHFDPHVVVVRVGSSVEFPNRDPFFHNVFSLFEGKRFDLGLYEAGTTRDVHFDRPGISYIFCNIHPEMSAVVIAVETPYYALSNQHGDLQIKNVPPGRYLLRVWYEASLPDDLNRQAREITIQENTSSLGTIRLMETPVTHAHKNKYGQDYEPPNPSSPAYERP